MKQLHMYTAVVLVAVLLVGLQAAVVPRVAHAVNASPFAFEAAQPDGTPVWLHIRGDERFHWKADLDGFTVVEDAGWFVYAERGQSGHLVPTDLAVGKADPWAAGLSTRILPTPAARAQLRANGLQGSASASDALQSVAPLGAINNLVVMVQFSNHVTRTLPSSSDVDVLFNAVGGDAVLAPTGSVRDVYLENSYGQMELNSTATGWMTVSNTEQYYADGSYGRSSKIWEALIEALNLADASIDFSQFDEDYDGDIDSITFIHSGYAAEWGGTDEDGTYYTDRIWSHKSIMEPEWVSEEGVRVGLYHISPGLWGTSGSDIGRIGVISHETGHSFGLPDLYDIDSSGGKGIGCFGMMGNSWGFDGSQHYPPHFCPWSKTALGWLTPTVISTAGEYSLAQVEDTPAVYRIDHGYPTDEYLLIENRQPVGFDGAMPQGGLAVWHIDDTADYNIEGYPGQTGWPENGNHYRVALLQADRNYNIEQGINSGDWADVYRGDHILPYGRSIDASSSPSTDAYQDGNIMVTGNTISEISSAGATMMFTYAIQDVASADFLTTYGTVSGSYVETRKVDADAYESITEQSSGGKPQNRHDRLDHVWSFPVSGGNHVFLCRWRRCRRRVLVPVVVKFLGTMDRYAHGHQNGGRRYVPDLRHGIAIRYNLCACHRHQPRQRPESQ
jgi:M6 family metalloprotease-like protein